METSPTPGTFMVVGVPLSTEETALEATLTPLLAALPATLAALLAALPAALPALLATLPAALAADEPRLEALDIASLVASWACEQLTAKAPAMARLPATAAARAMFFFIPVTLSFGALWLFRGSLG
jgi:hypothetical protein